MDFSAASHDSSDASFTPPRWSDDACDSGGSGVSSCSDSGSDSDSDSGSGSDSEVVPALPAKRVRTRVDYVALNEAMFGHVDVDNPEAFMQGACLCAFACVRVFVACTLSWLAGMRAALTPALLRCAAVGGCRVG